MVEVTQMFLQCTCKWFEFSSTIQWNLSNTDTIRINEVSLFQEENNLYKFETRPNIQFLFQECPLRHVTLHAIIIKTFNIILCNVPAHRDFKVCMQFNYCDIVVNYI